MTDHHFNKIIKRRQLLLEAEYLAKEIHAQQLRALEETNRANRLAIENGDNIRAIIAEIEELG